MVVRGTVQNGHVVPSQPLGLPEGYLVYIISTVQPNPERRQAALTRLRSRAVGIALPDSAFSAESLYYDMPNEADEG